MTAPRARTHPTIEVRKTWDDAWQANSQLRVVGAVRGTIGARGEDTLRLVRRYGPKIKYRAESDFTIDSAPLAFMDYWVRLLAADGTTVLWQGIIKDDRRTIRPSTGVQRGMQEFLAWGPKEVLRRVRIETSQWHQSEDLPLQELGHVPPMNYTGPGGELEGNRGPLVDGRSYVYGFDPGSLWSHLDYIRYVIAYHVQQYDAGGQKDGPEWSVTGETGALEALVTMARFTPGESALAVIRRLIPPSMGLDFAVMPTEQGYEVKVFAISKDAVAFDTALLPANASTLTINPTTDAGVVSCEVESSARERVDRLVAIGERIESCFTVNDSQKVKLWTEAQETAYKAGTGTPADSADKHDAARKDDAYRLVYGGHAADSTFDLQAGEACPVLDGQGEITGTGADRQTEMRESLKRLPLKEGGDYTTDPPNLDGAQEDYRPPLALAHVSTAIGYMPVDTLSGPDLEENESLQVNSMAVRALERDWGVIIEAPLNHELAMNHWAGTPTPADSKIDPDTAGIDYDGIYLTIAAKMDQRLRCYEDDGAQRGDGSKMVIRVAGAKLQWLTHGTVLGRTAAGALSTAPAGGLKLRNDNTLLHAVMAGAKARYLADRFRIVIEWNEIKSYLSKLGTILVMGSDEGDLEDRWALVTSVEWNFERGRTILRAGYAK